MPLGPMDDFLAHQTPETFDHVYCGDRNFYDRYYFNCHPCGDEIFLITGMGQYPNLGVIDAFVTVSHGDTHSCVRASRELGHDRLDTTVGPFGVEVLQGLHKLHLWCEPNEWDLDFDLVFEAFVPALEEPVTFRRVGNRMTEHTTRFAQVGLYQGQIRVGGETFDVSPDRWKGARDHSWGVRPNTGEAEPPGILAKYRPEGEFGHFHNWIPMQFDDFMIKVYFDEDQDGNRLMEEAVKVPRFGTDGPIIHLGSPKHDIRFESGTREIAQTILTFAHSDLSVVGTPLRTNYLLGGSGYRPDPSWGLGHYQGPLKVEGLSWDLTDPKQFAEIQGLNEMLCRWELSTGEVGYGMHENVAFGVYHPYGFETMDAVAP
ncbi:MAG: hypothetical protein CL908_26645 [Deltaproteobacteria bacterium]|nr:hypothetical protein [Deltaproteobacteria bacterium]